MPADPSVPVGLATGADPRVPDSRGVEEFWQRGTWVSGQVVPHALLDVVRALIADHQRRPKDRRLPADTGHSDWSPADGAGLRNSEFISIQLPQARVLTLMPIIGRIAATLLGTDCVRLFEDQAVEKPPGDLDAVVGWHTDSAYATTCTSDDLITAWIPFDDATAETGTLLAVPGSHRWTGTEDLRYFQRRDLTGLTSLVDGADVADPVTIDVRRGEVEFHHGRLVHASGPNRSDRPRLALAVTFQAAGNGYREVLDRTGTPVVLPVNRLCRRDARGRPDYGDDAVFPVVWSRAPLSVPT